MSILKIVIVVGVLTAVVLYSNSKIAERVGGRLSQVESKLDGYYKGYVRLLRQICKNVAKTREGKAECEAGE